MRDPPAEGDVQRLELLADPDRVDHDDGPVGERRDDRTQVLGDPAALGPLVELFPVLLERPAIAQLPASLRRGPHPKEVLRAQVVRAVADAKPVGECGLPRGNRPRQHHDGPAHQRPAGR